MLNGYMNSWVDMYRGNPPGTTWPAQNQPAPWQIIGGSSSSGTSGQSGGSSWPQPPSSPTMGGTPTLPSVPLPPFPGAASDTGAAASPNVAWPSWRTWSQQHSGPLGPPSGWGVGSWGPEAEAAMMAAIAPQATGAGMGIPSRPDIGFGEMYLPPLQTGLQGAVPTNTAPPQQAWNTSAPNFNYAIGQPPQASVAPLQSAGVTQQASPQAQSGFPPWAQPLAPGQAFAGGPSNEYYQQLPLMTAQQQAPPPAQSSMAPQAPQEMSRPMGPAYGQMPMLPIQAFMQPVLPTQPAPQTINSYENIQQPAPISSYTSDYLAQQQRQANLPAGSPEREALDKSAQSQAIEHRQPSIRPGDPQWAAMEQATGQPVSQPQGAAQTATQQTAQAPNVQSGISSPPAAPQPLPTGAPAAMPWMGPSATAGFDVNRQMALAPMAMSAMDQYYQQQSGLANLLQQAMAASGLGWGQLGSQFGQLGDQYDTGRQANLLALLGGLRI